VKELSWQLSKAGNTVLMVDADTYGASLHQELGIAPSNTGLLEACRAMEKRNATDVDFAELACTIAPNLSLLSGLPRASRWTDLRIPALRTTWQRAIASYDFVIVDVGGVLELDQSLLHESSLPRRHAASLTALAAASNTLVCARADSIGTTRLIRGYLEFHELFAESILSAVLWGTESDRDEREVAQAVTRHTGIQAITCIPQDWKVARESLVEATTISSLDQKCDVAQAYAKLATQISSTAKQVESLETKKRARSGFRSKRAA
jgi:MinD-like ATPase involved in chromosome partitioning or flagellar assembly